MDIEFKNVTRELLIKTDINGNIIDISSNCNKILGYNKTEMIETYLNDYIIMGKIKFTLNKDDNFELLIKVKNGMKIYFNGVLHTIYNENQEVIGARISLIDINKYKVIEESQIRLRNIVENSKDIIYMYELLPEPRFVYINQAVEEMLGVTVEDNYINPLLIFDITHPEEYEIQLKKVNGTLDYSKPTQIRLRNKNGQYLWFEDFTTPVYNPDGELIAIKGFCRNIQDRKELEMKLEELSYYDCLTGLLSRNYYKKQEKRLNELEDNSIGIIMCDMDNLKITNDSLGHAYGDRLLINFANLLKRKFDTNTVIARLGGDEFIVLFENISENSIKKDYSELHQLVEEYNKSNQIIPIQVSIGWAYSPMSLSVIQEVFNSADIMMYENKINKKKMITTN